MVPRGLGKLPAIWRINEKDPSREKPGSGRGAENAAKDRVFNRTSGFRKEKL